ncbi:MAG: DUF6305 family protein, partial [Candidatus Aminicenantales bacterium]
MNRKAFATIVGISLIAVFAAGQTAAPKAKLPVLTTSAGQSNDINAVNIVMEEADIKYDYCDVP